ncbi:NEDD8-conjugating protein ubc12 [Boothiomyces macroporosus]|uniref:NEDD8-conjugating protein ubc12 n=1 Tax=Boothiomyces macroporosus TaxID=261099 RepID=A0AAD5UDB6_9FUNG|nr:NEDD8-conjugating protein ubc12 [Boothiomyces macroporosus]
MINLMGLKKKQKEEASQPKKPKTTAAQIRIQKDLSELTNLPKSMKLDFVDPNNVFEFTLTIKPDEDDPLNKTAAAVLRSNRKEFEKNVKTSMRGGHVDGIQFASVV